MKIGKLAAAVAALGLVAAPAMAESTVSRSAAPVSHESAMSGEGQAAIGIVLVLLALAIGIAVGGDDTPASA